MQNKSNSSSVRVRMIDFPEDVSILSVNEICDNSQFKHKNNCWDNDGHFTAEFSYTTTKGSEEIILRRKRHLLDSFTFAYPVEPTNKFNTMTTNALMSDTEYEFHLSLKSSGENLRLISDEIYSNIGVLYSRTHE